MGSYLIFKSLKGKGVMEEMMQSMMDSDKRPPEFIIKTLELHASVFFLIYGIFMGYVTLYWSTDRWIFFKTAGFYIAFFIFFIFELIIIRFKMRRFIENQRKAEILKNF